MIKDQTIFESGRFFTGCNYWASHAGIDMWVNWRPEIVEDDLKRLSQANIRVLRMFPLWRDFQPLRMHRQGGALPKELRLGEDPLPYTEEGQAGLDPVMIDRFRFFCDLAEKYDIKLIVGLITGWMSGRMFMPEAFAGLGLISDPLVVRWQIRYVRYIVRHFKDHPAIAAWDLGNECNCMERVTRDVAFTWATQITNAIRTEDHTHPVVSGMHSLTPEGNWTPQDQGEALDILCTHPYPIFTPHCDTDPINEMKSPLHPTAESILYASLGHKPCFIEEAGTLGPMIADEDIAADYVRTAIFSAWAHDLRGFVWWCANEQSGLEHTPYDWNAVERQLGLFRWDKTKKPVLEVMTEFTNFVDQFRYKALPARLTDGVCILTHRQDAWAAGYGTFILAKQAGLDISFCWCDNEIPEAPVYFLPALTGGSAIYRHQIMELMNRVEKGATLYLSISDALLSPFVELTGIKVKTRSRSVHDDIVTLDGTTFSLRNPIKYTYENVNAKVLASCDDGNPALTEYSLGKGKVIFCAYAIELDAACKYGVVSGDQAVPYYQFYKALDLRNPAKVAEKTSPYLGLTEHIVSDKERLVLILNHTPNAISEEITLQGYRFQELITISGGSADGTEKGFRVTLPGNTGIIAVITAV